MSYASYGPRVKVHPDRYGADRSAQVPMVKYLILHTSEQSGAEDANDADDLARYLTSPGDRQGRNGMYGSSYHAITDVDHIKPCVVHYRVAYSAGGGNQYGLHLCLPVRANQTRAQWLDATSTPYIERAAEWIIDQSTAHNLPLRRISDAAMRAGARGYADHWTVTRAFGKSTHTDVGSGFPWDALEDRIAQLIEPNPDPEETMYLFRHPLYADVFLMPEMTHMTPGALAEPEIAALGPPRVRDDRELLERCCEASGFYYHNLSPMNANQVW